MTDLLVSSLMSDGGLESALYAAIRKEAQGIEDKKVIYYLQTLNIASSILLYKQIQRNIFFSIFFTPTTIWSVFLSVHLFTQIL